MTKKEDEPKIVKKKAIKNIEDLPGVGPAVAEKLREGGFYELMSIAATTPSLLTDAAGIGSKAGRELIRKAQEALEMGFESAVKVEKKRERINRISTGSEAFDTLIGGGVESGSITEVFGEFGSSKSQIAHILAVNVQKDDPKAIVFFIDSEGSFRPERIRQLAKGAELDENKVLGNIRVGRAVSSDHQMLLANKVDELISKDRLNVKLLVVDSVTAHFRAEFQGRGTLAPRQQKLNTHLHTLLRIADKYSVVVFVTNQVMHKPDLMFGDPVIPIGGNILGHISTTRIYLRKSKKNSRVAKLIDSPGLPDGAACFYVREGGLEDVKEK